MNTKKDNGYFIGDKETLQSTFNIVFGDKNVSKQSSSKISNTILFYGLGLGVGTVALCLLMLYAS